VVEKLHSSDDEAMLLMKFNFTLEQATKAQRGSKGIILLFL